MSVSALQSEKSRKISDINLIKAHFQLKIRFAYCVCTMLSDEAFFSKFRNLVDGINQIPASDDIKAVNEEECNVADAKCKWQRIRYFMHHQFREKTKNEKKPPPFLA